MNGKEVFGFTARRVRKAPRVCFVECVLWTYPGIYPESIYSGMTNVTSFGTRVPQQVIHPGIYPVIIYPGIANVTRFDTRVPQDYILLTFEGLCKQGFGLVCCCMV